MMIPPYSYNRTPSNPREAEEAYRFYMSFYDKISQYRKKLIRIFRKESIEDKIVEKKLIRVE